MFALLHSGQPCRWLQQAVPRGLGFCSPARCRHSCRSRWTAPPTPIRERLTRPGARDRRLGVGSQRVSPARPTSQVGPHPALGIAAAPRNRQPILGAGHSRSDDRGSSRVTLTDAWSRRLDVSAIVARIAADSDTVRLKEPFEDESSCWGNVPGSRSGGHSLSNASPPGTGLTHRAARPSNPPHGRKTSSLDQQVTARRAGWSSSAGKGLVAVLQPSDRDDPLVASEVQLSLAGCGGSPRVRHRSRSSIEW
jgi:hypothetical protein